MHARTAAASADRRTRRDMLARLLTTHSTRASRNVVLRATPCCAPDLLRDAMSLVADVHDGARGRRSGRAGAA